MVRTQREKSAPAPGSKDTPTSSKLSYSQVASKPLTPKGSFSSADGGAQFYSSGGSFGAVAQLTGGGEKKAPTAKDDWKTVGRKPTEKTAEDTEPIINVFKNVKTYFKSFKEFKKFNVEETLGEYCARNIIVHILYGDKNGGGHMVLSKDDEAKLPQVLQQKRKLRQQGREKESLFPKEWHGETIIENVVKAACKPRIIFKESDRYIFFGVIDNIIIKVVSKNENGTGIISGYPISDKSKSEIGELETFLRNYVSIVDGCISGLVKNENTVLSEDAEKEQKQMRTDLEKQMGLDKEKPLKNLGRLRGFVENCLQRNDWIQALQKMYQANRALKIIEEKIIGNTAESQRKSRREELDQVLPKLDEHDELEQWRQRLRCKKIKDQ